VLSPAHNTREILDATFKELEMPGAATCPAYLRTEPLNYIVRSVRLAKPCLPRRESSILFAGSVWTLVLAGQPACRATLGRAENLMARSKTHVDALRAPSA
jgi:hypothetical protein